MVTMMTSHVIYDDGRDGPTCRRHVQLSNSSQTLFDSDGHLETGPEVADDVLPLSAMSARPVVSIDPSISQSVETIY